jgi:hypothetical protein
MKRVAILIPILAGFIAGMAFVYSCGGGSSGSAATVEELEARLAVLEAKLEHVSVADTTINGLKGPHVIFEGVNLHVRNAKGHTGSVDGLGNLVIGHDEEPFTPKGVGRGGSHNLVVGAENEFGGPGGMVAGFRNAVSGTYAAIAGGVGKTAAGIWECDADPDYDSGWLAISQNQTLTLDHGLGGDIANYTVEMNQSSAAPHQVWSGGSFWCQLVLVSPGVYDIQRFYTGAFWSNLTDGSIDVSRNANDTSTLYVRVKIWDRKS